MIARIALIFALLSFAAANCRAANVDFQGRSYSVTVVTLGTNVPVSGVCDLIFVKTSGQKFLMIPTDATARGTFDSADNKQRFYMLDRSNNSNVIALTSIDGTLINLDGTFYSTTTQNPAFGQNPIETITRPLIVSSQENAVDTCIVSSTLLGYRTDGPSNTLNKIYSITRASSSAVSSSFAVTVKNADPTNNNLNAFLEYDSDTTNFLTFQTSLDTNLNIDIRDRISAYSSTDGTLVSELLIDNSVAFPNYSGIGAGIAIDPDTATIYLLDSANRQIFVITPRKPAISTISPNSGPTAGGTSVKITGVNLPGDVAVFFDGIPATGVTVASNGTSITATTPAHGVGVVNVTVIGTGISATLPLTLTSAFSYVNTPPNAVLLASPTQGLPPLDVGFDITGTGDIDGTLTTLTIDFGDGNSTNLPTNLSTLTTSHTYITEGTYTATLTAIDNQGASKKATQVIIVGEGAELTLRALSIKTDSTLNSGLKDSFSLKGEVVLPDNVSINGGHLAVAFINPVNGGLIDCPDVNDFFPAVGGGQFCANINDAGYVRTGFMSFNMKALTKLGVPENTYAFSFTAKRFDLDAALNEALVNGDGSPALPPPDKNPHVGKVLIVVRFETDTGEELQYVKAAVVQIKASKSSKVQLKRQ